MSNITKRLNDLEKDQEELKPIYVWVDRWGSEPMPPNPEGRRVIRFMWARCPEEATPDPSRPQNSDDRP